MDATLVGRYVVVHGQIVLQQFANYRDESIRWCTFVIGLVNKFEERGHTKLAMKNKSQVVRGENLNPSAKMAPISNEILCMRQPQSWSAVYLVIAMQPISQRIQRWGMRMMSKRYLRRNRRKMKKMMLRGRLKLVRNMFRGPRHQHGLEIHHHMLVKK